MKRKTAVILSFVSIFMCVLASCVIRDRSAVAEIKPEEYTVTFYQDQQVLSQEKVTEGGHAVNVPQGMSWRNETGSIVDPAAIAVTRDMAFYARGNAALRTGHIQYLTIQGEQFQPDAHVTRGQAAQMLGVLLSPDQTFPAVEENVFSDVTAGSPCYDSVQKLAALQVVFGYGDGTFRPDEEITRGELITLLCRLTGVSEIAATSFPDVAQTHWALGTIAASVTEGWAKGMGDGQFYPDYPATRAETVALIARICGRAPNNSVIDLCCQDSPYTDVPRSHWAYYYIIDASYRNELLSYVMGEMTDLQPGIVFLGDKMGHIDPETGSLDAYQKGFHTVSDGLPTDGLYYAPEDGFFFQRFQPGLQELDGSMFYVEQADGPFATDFDLGYLHFGSNGRYTSGDQELDGYVNAIMNPIIQNSTDNLLSEAKLREAYNVIVFGGYSYAPRKDGGWPRGSTNWTITSAKLMFQDKRGTCYYFAGAFLQLARRLGFQAYPICGGVGTDNKLHAWVMIDDEFGNEYIYDTELDAAYRNHWYRGISYTVEDMFKQLRGHAHVLYIFPGDTYTAPPKDDEGLIDLAIIWPSEVGGMAFVEVDGQMVALPTTWVEQYDESGNLTGYLVSVTYEGGSYSNTIPLAAPPVDTEPPVESPGPDVTPLPPDWTEQPQYTEDPGVTTPPDVTVPPDVTEPPIDTVPPDVTEPPVDTEQPVVTDPPMDTEQPVVTDPPVTEPEPDPVVPVEPQPEAPAAPESQGAVESQDVAE